MLVSLTYYNQDTVKPIWNMISLVFATATFKIRKGMIPYFKC